MSGTSINSIDSVLVDLSDIRPQVLLTYEHPLPSAIRKAVLDICQTAIKPLSDPIDLLAQLDCSLARLFADAVQQLLAKARLNAQDIRAIGSHGQTVRHAPNAAEPYTLQIGNPSLLAELTGIQTVADFRRRDMAAGGQGAPLAPAFHAAFFHDPTQTQVIVNIGGIANITVLPAAADVPVTGFDTGPGNTLLDAWAGLHLGKGLDQGGDWAASGEILHELLAILLQDGYFHKLPPKSTGREYFHLDWLQNHLNSWGKSASPQDIQTTLTALTAYSIADAIESCTEQPGRVLICGGGVHNQRLLYYLQQRLAPQPVLSTAVCGIDPDYLEAVGFAWLAQRTLAGLPGNLPTVTGARGLRILGGIYPA
jgi:anhydro-N-acetylmuramic acid kinase